MEDNFPQLDLPIDFLADETIDVSILRSYACFPCKIKSAILFLCTGGEISATINFSEYTIRKGDFVFLIPESFIQLHTFSDDLTFYFAGFSSGFLRSVNMIRTTFEFVPYIAQNPVLPLSKEHASVYSNFFKLSIEVLSTEGILLNREVTKSILTIWLEQLDDLYNKKYKIENNSTNISRDKDIYAQFIMLIHEHYEVEHSVSFYAEKVGVTLQHFCSTIKKASGNKASDIIVKFLVMEAKSRLKFTTLPVKNVSLSLGFSNTSFFYKWFKQHTGMTPLEYRES